ncbi:hypothetical protein WJX72_010028 [[Myrmecia] bisecta]|uniref:Protein kinase domain-containing protein n=1 Tax=[Myrmecia] bisecta TaxID=41462 RepID=A0AAW1QG41_9CHLO
MGSAQLHKCPLCGEGKQERCIPPVAARCTPVAARFTFGPPRLQNRWLNAPASSGIAQHRDRRLVRRAATADSGEPVDIDELARRLSQEADKLRQAERSSGGSSLDSLDPLDQVDPQDLARAEEAISSRPPPGPPQLPGSKVGSAAQARFGRQSPQEEADILLTVGDGGFCAQEFEIQQQLGCLSFVTEAASESPLHMSGVCTPEQTAVIAFTARYYSGLPFQDAVTTLLKEYLPAAKAVACNELQIMKHLTALPERKWHAARAPLLEGPPLVQLLGYFVAGQSDTGTMMSSSDEEGPSGPAETALWLVYKWEGLQPLSQYLYAQQVVRPNGFFWKDNQERAMKARCQMLRAIAKGTLTALAYCHELDVAHGSLGSGSIMLSTLDDTSAESLVVKLDNFGFGQRLVSSEAADISDDHPLRLAQQEDLAALGMVLLEIVFGALAEGGPSEATTDGALQRLWQVVFSGDAKAFRKYCSSEPRFMDPMLLLDEFEGAGWQLISDLTSGHKSAAKLLANPFCSL